MRLAIASALFIACGSDIPCPNDLPTACPDAVPSYRTDIDPIFEARCRSCHAPGGQEASILLLTHEQIFARRSAVLNQIYACKMPPEGAARPADGERALLLAWLVCGSPDN